MKDAREDEGQSLLIAERIDNHMPIPERGDKKEITILLLSGMVLLLFIVLFNTYWGT